MLQFDNLISFRMSVQLSDSLISHQSFFVWEVHISWSLLIVSDWEGLLVSDQVSTLQSGGGDGEIRDDQR